MSASARGLFRATGKTAKPVLIAVNEDLGGKFETVEHLEREPNDFYPTPPEPIRALIAAEGERLSMFNTIWECAVGDGAMATELERSGFDVIGSDLVDRGAGALIQSFYDFTVPLSKAIVTNPPFQECNGKGAWVWHALETLGVEYMALLLPLNWPGAGKERGRLWAEYPPARVYLTRWRIDFTGQGAPPMLNAWYVWDKSHIGETVLRMLDRSDPAQSSLLEDQA